MYNEQLLIDVIKSKTSYIVELAEDSTIELVNVNSVTTPRVYVGHLGIKPENPNNYHVNGYNEFENPSILLTSIQFICDRNQLAEVRTNIAEAYRNFTPFAGDSDYSSLIFMEAQAIAKTGNKMWWQEIVGLIFPRIS